MTSGQPSTTQLSQVLRDFGPPYFDHVLAEYEMVCSGEGVPPRVQEIIDKHKNGDNVTWGELYLLEKYVIYRQPQEVLKARLPGLRLSYREIAGSGAYEQYLQSRQAAPLDGPIEELRADVGRLLDALHWAYAIAPEREQVRSNLLRTIATEMLVSVIAAGAVGFAAYYSGHTQVATLVCVLLMGALGGFFSVQRRIENIPSDQDPILTMFQLQNGRFSVHLAPLTGAICALVLYLIFQAGLFKGAAFPDVGQLPAPEEYGKLLVWSFIAGFAERFIPDTLDNLMPKHEESATGKGGSMVTVGHKEPNHVISKPTVAINERKVG